MSLDPIISLNGAVEAHREPFMCESLRSIFFLGHVFEERADSTKRDDTRINI
jgi:hypothetical protein